MKFKRTTLWSVVLSCVSAVAAMGSASEAMMKEEEKKPLVLYRKEASNYMKAPKPSTTNEMASHILSCGLISDSCGLISDFKHFSEQVPYFIVNGVKELVEEARTGMFVVLKDEFAVQMQKGLIDVLSKELSANRQEPVDRERLHAQRTRIDTADRMLKSVEKFSDYIEKAYHESGNSSAEKTLVEVKNSLATLQSDFLNISEESLKQVVEKEEKWQQSNPARRADCKRKCKGNILDMAISEDDHLKNFFVNVTGKINDFFGEDSHLNVNEKYLLSACLMEGVSFVFRNTQMVMDAFGYTQCDGTDKNKEEQNAQLENDKMIPTIMNKHAKWLQDYYFDRIDLFSKKTKEEEKENPNKPERMSEGA